MQSKKRRNVKRLALNKETIRRITGRDLTHVQGGTLVGCVPIDLPQQSRGCTLDWTACGAIQ